MSTATDAERDPSVVLRESLGHLALVATRRLYDEQPRLWEMGEHGRARTLEDFSHHLRVLATLSEEELHRHVAYCRDLWSARGFPMAWLEDAWRIIDGVLADELPAPIAEAARTLLRRVVG